jgi:Mg2+ and Co2+ transporter CorA
MVPTLVASFIGMNVDMPFNPRSPLSFFMILVVSFGTSAVLGWYFQRKNLF